MVALPARLRKRGQRIMTIQFTQSEIVDLRLLKQELGQRSRRGLKDGVRDSRGWMRSEDERNAERCLELVNKILIANQTRA
jgi:hypothetical protein